MEGMSKSDRRWAKALLVLVAGVSLTAFLVLAMSHKPVGRPASDKKAQNPIIQFDSKSNPNIFDAQSFYDQVQNGMDLATLNRLAAKKGDCFNSGVYPPPESYPCYWSNGEYIVAVTLGSQGVTNKSIQPNETSAAH